MLAAGTFGGGGLALADGALGVLPEGAVGAAPRAAGIPRVPGASSFGMGGGAPKKYKEKADWSVGNFPPQRQGASDTKAPFPWEKQTEPGS